MKKRWLKLAAIGIMAGTLVVQAPVATYAGENGEAVVQQENGVGSEVATAEHVAKHLENTDEFNMERKDGIAYYSLKGGRVQRLQKLYSCRDTSFRWM